MDNNFYYNRSLKPPARNSSSNVGATRESSLRRFDLEKRRILRTLELVKDAKNKLMMERLSLVNQLMKVNKLQPGRQVEITISNKSHVTDAHTQNHSEVSGIIQTPSKSIPDDPESKQLVAKHHSVPPATAASSQAKQQATHNRAITHKGKTRNSAKLVRQEPASLSTAAKNKQTEQLAKLDYLMEQVVDPAVAHDRGGSTAASILELMVDGDFCVEDHQHPQEDMGDEDMDDDDMVDTQC